MFWLSLAHSSSISSSEVTYPRDKPVSLQSFTNQSPDIEFVALQNSVSQLLGFISLTLGNIFISQLDVFFSANDTLMPFQAPLWITWERT